MKTQRFVFENLPFNKVGNKFVWRCVFGRPFSNVYHSHDFYEIMLVLKGKISHMRNNITEEFALGDGAVLTPADLHKFLGQTEDALLLTAAIEKDEFLACLSYFSPDVSEANLVRFSCIGFLPEIEKTVTKPHLSITDSKLLLSYIFSSAVSETRASSPAVRGLETALEKMRSEENLKCGTQRLLELTNYSYSHLFRLTKMHYGKTPHELLFEMKTEMAYRLIVSTDLPLSAISLSLGIESVSHFHSVFKKKYNMSPGALRRLGEKAKTV